MPRIYAYNPQTDQWAYDTVLNDTQSLNQLWFNWYIKTDFRGPFTLKIHDRYWRNCFVSKHETNLTNLKYTAIQIA